MSIVRCDRGHYYDDLKTDYCPCCRAEDFGEKQSFNNRPTVYIDSESSEADFIQTEAYDENVTEYEKTIGIYVDEDYGKLTVGWLVCTKGDAKGKSFVLHSGRNFVGTAFDSDIVIPSGMSDTEDGSFSVVYDPKDISFYVVSEAFKVYLNGECVTEKAALNDGDIVAFLENEFVFIPFCKEGRDWK